MRKWKKEHRDGKTTLSLHLGGGEYAEVEARGDEFILYSANDTRRVEEDSFEFLGDAKKEAEGWT